MLSLFENWGLKQLPNLLSLWAGPAFRIIKWMAADLDVLDAFIIAKYKRVRCLWGTWMYMHICFVWTSRVRVARQWCQQIHASSNSPRKKKTLNKKQQPVVSTFWSISALIRLNYSSKWIKEIPKRKRKKVSKKERLNSTTMTRNTYLISYKK